MNPDLLRIEAILWTEDSGAGRLALEEGDLERAEGFLTAALERAHASFGEGDPRLAEACFHLARLRLAQGRAGEAEQLDRLSLALRESLLGSTHPDTRTSCLCLALFYPAPPPAVLERALEAGLERFGAHSWQVARLHGHLRAADHVGFGFEEQENPNPFTNC